MPEGDGSASIFDKIFGQDGLMEEVFGKYEQRTKSTGKGESTEDIVRQSQNRGNATHLALTAGDIIRVVDDGSLGVDPHVGVSYNLDEQRWVFTMLNDPGMPWDNDHLALRQKRDDTFEELQRDWRQQTDDPRAVPAAPEGGDLATIARGVELDALDVRDGKAVPADTRAAIVEDLGNIVRMLRAHRCTPGPGPKVASGAEAAKVGAAIRAELVAARDDLGDRATETAVARRQTLEWAIGMVDQVDPSAAPPEPAVGDEKAAEPEDRSAHTFGIVDLSSTPLVPPKPVGVPDAEVLAVLVEVVNGTFGVHTNKARQLRARLGVTD